MLDSEVSDLVDHLMRLPAPSGRRILAVVGPPGSGKSTFSETFAQAVMRKGLSCAIIPMDGFHFDDAILNERGIRPRKGAPETFDVAGLFSLLLRLRQNDEPEIATPVFDRSLEISRNAARIIPRSTEVLIVEGNYLLLDRPGWRDLAKMFDLTVALAADVEELRSRLVRRWRDHNVPENEISARVDGNDLPNGLTVLNGSIAADVTVFQSAQSARLHSH